MSHNVFRYAGGEFAELIVDRAEGSWLTTPQGRKILDEEIDSAISILDQALSECTGRQSGGFSAR